MTRKRKQGFVHMVNMSKYTAPVVLENKYGKKYVEYKLKDSGRKYKAPNGYYLYLYDRAKGSTTNGAVIKGICDMIYGRGLGILDQEEDTSELLRLKELISDKDLKKLINDRKKLMMCALQVTKTDGEVTSIDYMKMKDLLPSITSDGDEVKSWYYHTDWNDMRGLDPIEIPAYGYGESSGNEIYIIGNHNGESEYFCEDEGYTGSLPYALLEEEIADYQINDAQNSFSPSTVINYNNGIPDDEDERKKIVRDTADILTGSKGKKVIVSFNDNKEAEATVEKIPLDNAPEHYDYLSEECEAKILKGHRAISELLGFNSDSSGFSNNAEELRNKFLAFEGFVIKPYQHEFTDALEEITGVKDLYFKSLNPFEAIDIEKVVEEEEEVEEQPETNLSKDDFIADMLIGCGEEAGDNWELVSSEDVDYDIEGQLDLEIQNLNKEKVSLMNRLFNFVSTGTARPNAKSEQDREYKGDYYKVRYSYEGDTSVNSRLFCVRMTAANKLYRKEDIIRMDEQVVNAGWGPKGADTYSIWLYKGGGGCHHKWKRNTYRFTGRGAKSGDPTSPNAQKVAGFVNKNDKKVAQKPKDMANRGFLN